MFRYLNLRTEEDNPKEEEVENEEELDEKAEGDAEEKKEDKPSDAEKSGEDKGEGDKKAKDDSGEKDDGDEAKDEGSKEDSSGKDDGQNDKSDSTEKVEEEASKKQDQQPVSEAGQQTTENTDLGIKDTAAQPHEVGAAEVSASGSEVSANSPTVVLAAFSGCGKTSWAAQREDVKDLESSLYSKKADGSKNPDFPGNYINMIKWHLVNNNWKYLLISAHDDVRKALKDDGINFFTLYPEKSRKEEFLKNFKERGNTDEFIKLMEDNWDTWIDELAKETKSYGLKENEYLSDSLFDTSLKFLKQ